MKVSHSLSLVLDVGNTMKPAYTEDAVRLRLLKNTPVEELRPGGSSREPSVPAD